MGKGEFEMVRARRSAGVLVSLLIGVGFVSGCSTPTAYQSADEGYGFTEKKTDDSHYRVEFRGNSLTDREVVETYLLYRLAEVTRDSGNDYFIILDQDTDKKTSYVSSNDYPFGAPFHYHYYPYYWHFEERYRQPIQSAEKFTAVAEIFVGPGDKPADNPNAYDARSVMEHLDKGIARPDPDAKFWQLK
jgi:hypothetical protein